MRLMEPLLDMGHNLFVDNWYTSYALFKAMAARVTPACCTLRKVRARFPPSFVSKKLKSGECLHVPKNDVLGLRFHDKRDVYFLSTMHRPQLVSTPKRDKEGNVIMKEKVVTDYNSGMGFVDKNDAIISQHDMVRKCQKWATKMAFHLIEEALLNAHILYGMSPEPILTYTNFKLVYIENVLSPLPESEVRLQRYEGQHYLEKVPSTKPTETSRMRRCVCPLLQEWFG